MATSKMVNVPLRLEGDVLRTMQALSRLSGYDIDTVCSVLVVAEFFRDYRHIATGLRAKAAEEAAERRPGPKRPKARPTRRARPKRS